MTEPTNDSTLPLLLFEHPAGGGRVVAEARLSSEKTLNALSLAMIEILAPALARWADDPRVAAVLLTGAGERAFSAGGDIQALYQAMARNHGAGKVVDDYPTRFFEQEYRLDYRLHTFAKPLISIGQGVVMGGGLGVFSGARYRIVTETSRLAMPEVTIGLFPDAGATWLMAAMPRHMATFCALTGAPLNGADALAAGIATHSVASAERALVLEALQGLAWSGSVQDDHELVGQCLDALPVPPLPAAETPVLPAELSPDGSIQEVAGRVRELAGRSDWAGRAVASMDRGCPASIGIIILQLARVGSLTLADSFRLEMVIASRCAANPDFAEGVRALIIDKDNQPRWRFPDLEALPQAYVDEHFVPPWQHNPLANLEESP